MKLHPGPEWHIFYILTSGDIHDVISRSFTAVLSLGGCFSIQTLTLYVSFYVLMARTIPLSLDIVSHSNIHVTLPCNILYVFTS